MKKLLYVLFLILPISASAGEYIVKLKPMSIMSLDTQAELMGLAVTDRHNKGNLVQVSIPEEQKIETLTEIQQNPSVEYVVESFKLHAVKSNINPVALREQWAIKKVNAEAAWNLAGNKGSNSVIVAVIDTGVDYTHESLAPNMVKGYDFKANDSDPMDETSSNNPGHGTHCAGIVGATGAVENGITGLSAAVSIMPLRFLGADGSGDLMAGIKAVDFAIENGAKIISASWGAKVGAAQAQPLIDAVKRASDAGVIFISAAGNDGSSNDRVSFYPANAKFENTITVAASDEADAKPSWSNFGTAVVDMSSPGDQIMSTIPGNKYMNLRGTSMATPLVSGLVALLASQNPNITGAQVRSLIQTTGAKVSIETACNCRIDAGAAMTTLKNEALVVVPAAATIAPNATLAFSGFMGKAPYTFSSSTPAVATIDADGTLTAKTVGQTVVSVTDSLGAVAKSLAINVVEDNGGGGGGGGSCPIGDQATCDIICGIYPEAPFCQGTF